MHLCASRWIHSSLMKLRTVRGLRKKGASLSFSPFQDLPCSRKTERARTFCSKLQPKRLHQQCLYIDFQSQLGVSKRRRSRGHLGQHANYPVEHTPPQGLEPPFYEFSNWWNKRVQFRYTGNRTMFCRGIQSKNRCISLWGSGIELAWRDSRSFSVKLLWAFFSTMTIRASITSLSMPKNMPLPYPWVGLLIRLIMKRSSWINGIWFL